MSKHKIYSSLLLGALVLGGCAKTKLDTPAIGNRPTDNNIASSVVRLVNIGGFSDLAVNGQKLTNFVIPYADGTRYPSPTVYFPATGTLGSTYFIPQEFFNGADTAGVDMVQVIAIGNGNYGQFYHHATVKQDYKAPMDYYGYSLHPNLSDSIVPVPRALTPATDPTHIKVRLLNLSTEPDDASLTGPMTLTLADGTPLSAATTNVNPGAYSDYVELPYGAYQFRVFTQTGLQVPGQVGEALLQPMTILSQFNTMIQGTTITYAPVKSYQPGGVYTIAIGTGNGNFQYPYGFGDAIKNSYNAYNVITDITPASNLTYSRLQAVNAFPGNNVRVLVDGQALGGTLSYDSATDYRVLVTGDHKVEIDDDKGGVLAQKTITLKANTNFTAWVYPSGTGADVVFAQNNLSGSWNTSFNGDGTDNANTEYNTTFPMWIRFINLCPELPYVTFTQADGVPFPDYYFTNSSAAAQNLQPGVLPDAASVPFPYSGPKAGNLAQIQAYQSKPLVVPGDRLTSIPALKGNQFGVMPLSAYGVFGLPNGEPGVYTVALVGHYGTNVPAGQEAKMIIIKHTK